jgi:hypothetical protein
MKRIALLIGNKSLSIHQKKYHGSITLVYLIENLDLIRYLEDNIYV